MATIYEIKKDTTMKILDKKSTDIASFFTGLGELLDTIQNTLKNRTSYQNGENFLSNHDVCRMLHISSRALQDWRDTGKILFIQINGKIQYKQPDILNLLKSYYV